MPVRGRADRPHSSADEVGRVFGEGTAKSSVFQLGLEVVFVPTGTFDLGLMVVDRYSQEFALGLAVADLKTSTFNLGLTVADISGDTITAEAFQLGLTVGEPAGYASPSRVNTPSSLRVGQEVQRRGQVMPSDE